MYNLPKISCFRISAIIFLIQFLFVLSCSRNDQTDRIEKIRIDTPEDFRNRSILSNHPSALIGIDISHYQGEIEWQKLKTVYDRYPIRFIFVRATMGADGRDLTYRRNWQAIRQSEMTGGVYHYYRPNENSTLQAQNYIQNVRLMPGDFVPILDIEELPTIQSMDRLKTGIQNWLNIVENHFGVRPMIYSHSHYYDNYLSAGFSRYPTWIANYSIYVPNRNWHCWQFTQTGYAKGIRGKVDINIFNGSAADLSLLTIR